MNISILTLVTPSEKPEGVKIEIFTFRKYIKRSIMLSSSFTCCVLKSEDVHSYIEHGSGAYF
jgi:hypothetical protein